MSSVYDSYSIVGNIDKAWSQLTSLKVFKPASWIPSLNIVDVARTKSRTRTFDSMADLTGYLDINPILT